METKTKIHHFKGGSFSHCAGSKEGDKSKANNYSRVLEETYNHVIFYTAFYIYLCLHSAWYFKTDIGIFMLQQYFSNFKSLAYRITDANFITQCVQTSGTGSSML